MKTSIRKMGNSQGVLLPKLFLAQAGLDMGEVDIAVEDNAIVIRRAKQIREGWEAASKVIAEAGDDKLTWPDLANDDDKDWVW